MLSSIDYNNAFIFMSYFPLLWLDAVNGIIKNSSSSLQRITHASVHKTKIFTCYNATNDKNSILNHNLKALPSYLVLLIYVNILLLYNIKVVGFDFQLWV